MELKELDPASHTVTSGRVKLRNRTCDDEKETYCMLQFKGFQFSLWTNQRVARIESAPLIDVRSDKCWWRSLT